MKNYTRLMILLPVFCLFFQIPQVIKADSYEVKDRKITLPTSMIDKVQEKEEETVINLINTDRTLSGLIDHAQYHYSIPAQGAKSGSMLKLHMKYSQLLLPSSTITILIDDQPIKSVPIDTGEKQIEINIPLEDDMLTPGFHEVTVSFYGHITKEICENEENPGNWLTILATSSVLLHEKNGLAKKDVLETFPYPFIQPEKENTVHTKIVVPNEPSTNILSSALKVANYFGEQANDQIPVIREKDLQKIDSHFVVIGALDQWDGVVSDLFNSVNIDGEQEKLVISNYFLESLSSDKQMMFVTAQNDQDIADNIHLLTEPTLIDQLSGNELVIDHVPEIEMINPKENHPFSDMNIPNQQLTGKSKLSQTYFYQLPPYIDEHEDAILHLMLNFSETLLDQENQQAELVIYINDVPHSVAVDHLMKEDEKEFYKVKVPIDARFLNEDKYLSLQFEGNGLRSSEFCVPPHDDEWIYIHEDSFIKFPMKKTSKDQDFSNWPAPFITNELSETTIVLPDSYEDEFLEQLGEFTRHLGSYGTLIGLEFIFEKDVIDEQLKNRNVIILGHMDDHPSLESHTEKFMLNVNEMNQWDVSDYHFLQETSAYVSWLQPSVWDKNKTMAVFSAIRPNENMFLGNYLSEYLETNKIHSTIVVENQNGEIFTYTPEHEEENDQSIIPIEQIEEENNLSIWVIIGFLVVFFISIGLLVVLFRRRKRDF